MAGIFNILGAAIPSLDTAEIAAWVASNPLDGDVVYDSDNSTLVAFDEATLSAIVLVGGGGMQTYSGYVKGYSGATYTNADLIDAEMVAVYLDNLLRYPVVSSPDPGNEYSFDSTTGTIDIGTSLDGNDLYFIYKSLTAPIS